MKLFLCSVYFAVFSTFVFAVEISEDNFDQFFNNSYNAWFLNREYWETSIENKKEKILMLDVFLNEEEIDFLQKLFPNITILVIRVDTKNSFFHEDELFFGELDWDVDEGLNIVDNKKQSEFTSIQIEKLLNIYPSITTFHFINKNDIQMWLNNFEFFKKLTHLNIETDTLTNEQLHKLSNLELEFFRLIYTLPSTNIKILDKMNCRKEVQKK
ncbi:MAG: hypothetical protein Q8L85_01230 [Alphaproteobacteria bacterium]|nr:hypothetical protein [Alphaproteobacteria bacterium]